MTNGVFLFPFAAKVAATGGSFRFDVATGSSVYGSGLVNWMGCWSDTVCLLIHCSARTTCCTVCRFDNILSIDSVRYNWLNNFG